MTTTVEMREVGRRYGRIEAVREVSFELPAAQTVALVGHNGAGKTTLMKLMLGLLRPSAGSVRVLGDDPATNGFAIRRRLGYLPENVSLNPALTGRETLAFYARLKGERVAHAATLLDQVGIAGAASRRVATYSKGMRQRLGLAQALIGRPLILLLDEPTTGLDPELRQRFYEITEEARNRGATVLLSSHALAELGRYADRVIVMNHGRLVADGTLDALRRIARLPTRIRLTLKDGELDRASRQLASVSPWRRINGEVIETDAAPDTKIEILRRVAGIQPIADIEVFPPTLDDVYAHFMRQGALP